MNPMGPFLVLIGVVMIIVGVKGTQHQIIANITGHPASTTGASTTAQNAQNAQTTSPATPASNTQVSTDPYQQLA